MQCGVIQNTVGLQRFSQVVCWAGCPVTVQSGSVVGWLSCVTQCVVVIQNTVRLERLSQVVCWAGCPVTAQSGSVLGWLSCNGSGGVLGRLSCNGSVR